MTKIKNKRQLAASKAWLDQFRRALKAAKKNPAHLDPHLLKAELDGMRSQIRDLELEVKQYEDLQGTSPEDVVLTSLDDLPEALARMRIVRGLTQEQLAGRLGIKPQQVQKWEAGGYQRASYASVLKAAKALGIDVAGTVVM
jgi:HTH-type transcriptional regulator/antitoxin HigA